MKPMRPVGARLSLVAVVSGLMLIAAAAQGQSNDQIRVVNIQGVVEVSTDGGIRWVKTTTSQPLRAGDHLRTLRNTRAAIQWSDSSVVPCGPLTEIEVLPPHAPQALAGLRLFKGILSFFHRDRPGRIRVITRGAVAGIEGTEFVIAVDAVTERTTLSVIDGLVSFSNEVSTLTLTNGQQAVATPGSAPQRIAGFVAHNLLQWAFYYPAVLDLRDAPFSRDEEQALAESLAAYRAGDLLDALAKYGNRQPASEAERIYQAALLLAVGEAGQTSNALAQIEQANSSERVQRLAAALRQQIAAVQRDAATTTREPELATELLAASYYEQSRAGGDKTLKHALDLAKQAATTSPEFGFAWERVAELEFSFGRTDKASEALNKSLALSPRNAQALALQGFLFAAQNKPKEAIAWFDRALAVDSALGNAWLGRGLCRIRRGDRAGGQDLLIAAALEPQRSLLRSYLGKSFAHGGDSRRAIHELDLARKLDANDPTAWLYSALVKADHNRINEAIRDLEKSQELNENRSVYRSSLLLDQDRAVRSVNLANIYRDAGMSDVSLREAAHAANADYANYSAHLFLAGSYNELRDPKLINLRYETAASAEYLLANLLAPVDAGTLTPAVSQQEYARLFERDRFGVVSGTEYSSGGDWIQSGAQYGIFHNSAYSVEGFYRTENGQRPNNDLEQRLLSLNLKQQLTLSDSIFAKVTLTEQTGGDLTQYYDQRSAARAFRFEEKQEPLLTFGYHREWSPGSHTLFVANWINDRVTLTNPEQSTLLLVQPDGGGVTAAHALGMQEQLRAKAELVSAELQQIVQRNEWTTIMGVRGQGGDIRVHNHQAFPSRLAGFFPDPPEPAALQNERGDFRRFSGYLYQHWQAAESLRLIAGVAYDYIEFPENFRNAPISMQEKTVEQVSPKAGLIWRPVAHTVVRFGYSRSLGGAALDQSLQIEPAQIAGFVQSFRSVIPESVVGANAGARFETIGLALDQEFQTGTYFGAAAEVLHSRLHRTIGAFSIRPPNQTFAAPSRTIEHIDYAEHALVLSANQLIGNEVALGARYRMVHSELENSFEAVPRLAAATGFDPRGSENSLLHQITFVVVYNHRCGFFSRIEALWNGQESNNYQPARSFDHFWQFNALGGYRFARRRAEVSVGVLNITDENYRLNPLTPYNELPRERTFLARLQLNF